MKSTYNKFKKQKGNILVIGDTHIPYEHKGYLSFCKLVAKKYNCTRFIHIGDEVDMHASSYHEADPNLLGANEEAEVSVKRLKKWYKAFPEMLVCIGNHSAIPERKLKSAGLPMRFMRAYREAWEAPSGWEWDYEFILDNVLFKHVPNGGSTLTGQLRGSERNMMSTVTGHTHSIGGVAYAAGYKDTVFALAVGCGIDRQSLAFEYGKNSKLKPLIGCGVVEDGGRQAHFIPMDLKNYNQKKRML
jgi:hypothetical protein